MTTPWPLYQTLVITAVSLWRQVRNKWLRILETTGGRAGNMTGASSVRQTPSADSASASGSYNSAASRGRGRRRGAQRGRGGHGGSRVIPRQPAPPAMVGVPLRIICYLGLAFNILYNILGPSTRTRFFNQSLVPYTEFDVNASYPSRISDPRSEPFSRFRKPNTV